jgi:hypothetical protein
MLKVALPKPFTVSDGGFTLHVRFAEDGAQVKFTTSLNPPIEDKAKATSPEDPALIRVCGSCAVSVKSAALFTTATVAGALVEGE